MKQSMKFYRKVLAVILMVTMLVGCGGNSNAAKVSTKEKEDNEKITTQKVKDGEELTEDEDPLAEMELPAGARQVPEGYDVSSNLTAKEIVGSLKAGWNLGNSLDAQGGETNWGNPKTTKKMIDAVAKKGFKTIRIPVSWGQYTSDKAHGYKIDQSFLKRVGDVVDYAIANDMYVILNTHHETDWIIPEKNRMGDAKNKFISIWKQIATYFAGYNDKLIFEGLNEPRVIGGANEWVGGTSENRKIINDLEAAFVKTVRGVGYNNSKRLLLLTSEAACIKDDALKDVVIPKDSYIAMSLHAYTPYEFCFSQGANYYNWDGSKKSDIKWGFDQMKKYFLDKNIPVVITEFGAERKGSDSSNNDAQVVKWMKDYMTYAKQYHIPTVVWDNNVVNGGGERFGLLNRSTLKWERNSIVDAMLKIANN